MKTALHLILGFMVCVSLAACGGSKQNEEGEHQHEHSEGEEHKHNEGEEHPEDEEHPEGEEHPDESSDAGELTIEEFADAAENYIEQKTEKQGGFFKVKDEKQDKTLRLTLKKVHRKRLSHLGDNTYFVCADFMGKDGNLYDIDIFMEGTSQENLKASKKPIVHKVGGVARYNWYEDNGTWKRKKAETKQ